jgi:methionyl-tRNA formyltransferase
MQDSSLSIVFMGTPDFAVPSLEGLIQAGFPILAVITAPDRPGGRGMKSQQSAIKKYALERNIKILQPEKLKNPEFLESLKELNPDIQVVVAFRMLPESVWNKPRLGTINLHGSLLPQYRGAAPIHWAIINGEKMTGVTTFRLRQEIDTGNILMQERFSIGEKETAGELHDRMKELGARVLVKTVQGIRGGILKESPQENIPASGLHPAPKIKTETCIINWNLPILRVFNLIRGLSPLPGAFTYLNSKIFKIFTSEMEDGNPSVSPGLIQTDYKTYLKFACPDGWIHVRDIQIEGKKRMGVLDFLRGFQPGQLT